MRVAATQAMSDIVEERQQSRCPPAAAPLRAASRRPAGFVARSSHTAPGIARRSRLASGLRACSKMRIYFCAIPKVSLSLRLPESLSELERKNSTARSERQPAVSSFDSTALFESRQRYGGDRSPRGRNKPEAERPAR